MMISSEDNCIACFPVTNMSQMFLKLPFALLVGAFTVMMLKAHGQDQSDFISIDCGQLQTKEYTEPTTGITYGPETVDIVDTGVSKPIVVSDPRQQFQFVRMFPEGTRNCYKINIKRRQKYLIRASFLYGNYDGDKDLPEFLLHLGGGLWDSVVISNASSEVVKELIHIPMRYYIHICLVNIDKGIPFISTIELRPLHKDTYQTESGTSLALHSRNNMAANKARYRYPEDVNDRIWSSWMSKTWKEINTSFNINTDKYQLPSLVLRTAATPKDDSIKKLSLMWQHSVNATYHFYWHFAEIIKFNSGLSRDLTININGKSSYRAIPQYLRSRTSTGSIAVGGGPFNFQIDSPPTSSYGPILNAYEIYTEKKLGSETDQQDVEALTNLKSTYGIIKNWQGDPCYPKEYIWAGVNCSYSDNDSARIISLNLSSSGLTEEIAASIFNLTMIQTLDLSNNKLSGQIPEYLSQLPKLNILNLEKNDLTGSVPAWLIAKENDGFSLSLCGNPSLSGQLPCGKQKKKKKKNQFVIPVVVLIIIVSWVSFAAALVWKSKRFRAYWRLGKDSCTESENEQSSRGHDVFLSFRGDDIREGFARYLHDALDKNGIKTFFDDQNLQKGDEIGPTLVNAIEASEVSIILFSKNYVTSSWCLGELVHIIDCKKKNKDRRVVPVFYKVNPSDIRNQSGSFSLQTWIDRENVKVPVWKEALVEVANLSGYHYTRGYESETIEKIVENISGVLKQMKENSLRRFDTICPEGGEDEIVIYTTSSARDKNFQKCQTIIQSLSQFVLKVQQRDVTIRKFRKELKKLMKKDMPHPRVFVHGRYVGGYDEVSRLITNEPWFCETLDKIQKRDEVRLHGRDLVQQEDASSVSVSETDPGGRGGSPV